MSLKDSVEESVVWARQRLERIRVRYLEAIHDAERQGGSRLEEVKRQVEQLGPSLRHLVDGQVEALQHKLDEINQRLAEEAVPEERKSRVGRLALERKAASAAQKASSVVRSRTRGKTAERTASGKAGATSGGAKGAAKGATKPPKTNGRKKPATRTKTNGGKQASGGKKTNAEKTGGAKQGNNTSATSRPAGAKGKSAARKARKGPQG